MTSPSLPRLFFAVIASLFVLASCGDSDESASSTTTISTTSTSTTVEAEAPDQSTTSTTAAEDTTTTAPLEDTTETTVDERTAEEVVIDDLDVMMFQLGVLDLEDTANCVIERLESENIELTGEGTAELIALSACEPGVVSRWLPRTNAALPTDVWACTVENIGDWINTLSIPDAESFLSAATPPAAFVELTATRCNASTEEIAAALSSYLSTPPIASAREPYSDWSLGRGRVDHVPLLSDLDLSMLNQTPRC